MSESDLELIVVLLALLCVAVAALMTALHAYVRRRVRWCAPPNDLDLIRHGIRTCAVVTAIRSTGVTREGHREVELDLMVRRPHGGQFPARETALVPVSAAVAPGSIVDTYYRPGDESAIAVCVPPS